MNGTFIGQKRSYTVRSNSYKGLRIDWDLILNFRNFAITFWLLFAISFIYMLYYLTGQYIVLNAQRSIYIDMMAKNEAINLEILSINKEINQATGKANIGYRASKEIGMIKRNDKKSVLLTVPSLSYNRVSTSVQNEKFENFNFLDAIISIFN